MNLITGCPPSGKVTVGCFGFGCVRNGGGHLNILKAVTILISVFQKDVSGMYMKISRVLRWVPGQSKLCDVSLHTRHFNKQ